MRVRGWHLLAAVALATAGCHARPNVSPARTMTSGPAAAPHRPAPPPPPAAAPSPTRALTDEELFERKSLAELNAEHPLGDAFFDYNKDALRDDARTALQRDAAWLNKWHGTRVMIEGHCDERGTAEYNLALGDRRAQTVSEYLASLGVDPSRIEVRSVGKEDPFCSGDGEACWSQNRRGHFLITAK